MHVDPEWVTAGLAAADVVLRQLPKRQPQEQIAVSTLVQHLHHAFDKYRELEAENRRLRAAADDRARATMDVSRGVYVTPDNGKWCPVCPRDGLGLVPLQWIGGIRIGSGTEFLGQCPKCKAEYPQAFRRPAS